MGKPANRRVEDQRSAEAALKEHGTPTAAAAALGIPRSTLQSRVKAALRGEAGGPPIPDIGRPPEGFIVTRNSAQYDEFGNVKKQWVGTARDSGTEYSTPDGHQVVGESAFLDRDGRVLAKWVKTREGATGVDVGLLREALKEFDGTSRPIPAYKTGIARDLLTLYPIPDLHVGMFSWGKETGESYDVQEACRVATESITTLVSQSQLTKHAVLLLLGDFFHANDAKLVTPAHGNKLDVDGRWQKVFKAGVMLTLDLVRIVAARHPDVEVVVLPGNHDPDSAMSLSVALEVYFSNQKRIHVWGKPSIAWYRKFGKVLMGSTHGHTMNVQAMANMMAADMHREWGDADFCYMYCGHIHQPRVQEVGRVRVEFFASPAAKDAYAHVNGFRNTRSLSALTISSNLGEVSRHQVNLVSKL